MPADSKPNIFRYTRCRNCGRFLLLRESMGSGFCSDPCQARYTRCNVCGRYFESSDDDEVCSKICAGEYKLNKKYG